MATNPRFASHTVTLSDDSTVVVTAPDWINGFRVIPAMFDCLGGVQHLMDLYRDCGTEVNVVFFAGMLEALAERPENVAMLFSLVSDRDVAWYMREKALTPDDMLTVTEAVWTVLPFDSLSRRVKGLMTDMRERFKASSGESQEPSDGDTDGALPQ